MIGYACFYRRGDAQRLVNPSEIVVHEVEGHGRFQVLHLFREGICQAGKAPHAHPHREVLPLHERRGDILPLRTSIDDFLPCPKAAWRAVSGLSLRGLAVQLDQASDWVCSMPVLAPSALSSRPPAAKVRSG